MYTATLLPGHRRGLNGQRPVTPPPSRVEKTMEAAASKLRALSQAVAMGPPSVPPGRPGQEAMQGLGPTLEACCRHRSSVPCFVPFLPWARKEGWVGQQEREALKKGFDDAADKADAEAMYEAGIILMQKMQKIAEHFEAKSEPLEHVFSNVTEIEGIRRDVQWQFEARE
uniref:Uncharacterized protein n=1 Tax=Oryza meridionalis TaxID=40149 RepID=A0A0E0D2Q6_9ORYZ